MTVFSSAIFAYTVNTVGAIFANQASKYTKIKK